MRLTNLIASREGTVLHGEDHDIAGLTADSREVKPGFLFIAIPGTAHDGRDYIPEAIKRGAVAVLIPNENPPPLGGGLGGGSFNPPSAKTKDLLTQVQVFASSPQGEKTPALVVTTDIRRTISAIAAQFYPRQPETIAAITGTSGKTSTAQFTRELWQTLGHKSASIGTLGLVTKNESRYGSLTTPDAITLHRLLDETAGKGITHLAMEASSHGLAMNRLDHVHVKVAAFTNLSRDHLDFHGTMEKYFDAKMRLFGAVLPEGGTAVLNADAPEFGSLSHIAKSRKQKIISYGLKGSDIQLQNVKPDIKGQVLSLLLGSNKYEILLPIIGKFQAWNAMAALGVVLGSGEDPARAVKALGHVSGVPGRLELVGHTKNGAAVFVDYAHKPDALENVLTAIRPHVAARKGARLGVVFGCGGNRDKGKRPIMGEIAQRLADWVIVTDDNPRHENPDIIRREILAGSALGENLREIGDRAKAIAAGIEQLRENDILIIAGKGHETGQIVGDKTLPFDDADVARKALAS